ANHVLASEFAVHDGQPPVAPAFQLLAELPGVAEETQVAAQANALVLDHRQTIVTGGRRASENTLAEAGDERLLQRVAAEREKKEADAGPAIRGLIGRKRALDARLRVTADDGGGVARRRQSGGLRPARRLGRDDEPRCRHGEGFGEGVFDGNVVDCEQGDSLHGVVGSWSNPSLALRTGSSFNAIIGIADRLTSQPVAPTIDEQAKG